MTHSGPAQIEYELAVTPPKVSLERLAENFATRPTPARAAMTEMFETRRSEFIAEAIALIRSGKKGQGHRFILTHLTETGAFLELLVDRTLLTQEESIELMRTSMRLEPQFDVRLMRWLVDGIHKEFVTRLGPRSEALLDVLAKASPGNRLLPVAIQLLRSTGAHVRSKAAMLIAQLNHRVDLALTDSDARVRANAIEALWGHPAPGSRRALATALEDTNNRVVGNAILGFFKLGDLAVVPRLLDMARHPSPPFRATAAWTIGQTGDRAFLPRLEELVRDPADSVTSAARGAIARFETPDAKATAEARAAAPLRILRITASGSSRLRLSAVANFPKAPPELPLTAHLSCNGQPVLDVRMHYNAAGALAIGVLLPDGWPREVHHAIRQLLKSKHEADRVALCSYQPGRPIQIPPKARPAPPRAVYSLVPSVPPRLRWNPGGPGLIPTLQALLAAPTGLAAQTNLLLFATEAESLQLPSATDSLMMIAQQADEAGALLHVIAAPNLPESAVTTLQAACAETGGYFLHCRKPADYATNTERILHILRDGIEVTYRATGPTAGSNLELQIVSETTIARTAAVCADHPYHAQNGSTIWYCD